MGGTNEQGRGAEHPCGLMKLRRKGGPKSGTALAKYFLTHFLL